MIQENGSYPEIARRILEQVLNNPDVANALSHQEVNDVLTILDTMDTLESKNALLSEELCNAKKLLDKISLNSRGPTIKYKLEWNGKKYTIETNAELLGLIVLLPTGEILQINGEIETYPPQIGRLEQLEHVVAIASAV